MSTEGHIEELGDDIVSVRADNPGPLTLSGTRTYVIGRDPLLVLDPGPADDEHLTRVDRAIGDRRVAAVCLTHAHGDHAASAEAVAGRWGELRASSDTLDRIGLPGASLEDDERIEFGGASVRAIATPGHSGDHLCFWIESTGDLFTGDLILGAGSTIIVHPDGSVRDYLASLARLERLRPTRLLPGHGPIVVEAMRRLELDRRHRVERTRQVLDAVEAGASSPRTIREHVYVGLPEAYHAPAEISIQAYLAYLAEEGHDVPFPAAGRPRREGSV
ncbi:MAG: MBL fold metallo-hydrolase [Gemmatimonadetes bacterium]|nr:MBL fold metallo-hydrolase [Gemmatimonadota bacterium]